MLSGFEEDILLDRLEGWELVEFLQVPIRDILDAALDNDWINSTNIQELLEFIGVKE